MLSQTVTASVIDTQTQMITFWGVSKTIFFIYFRHQRHFCYTFLASLQVAGFNSSTRPWVLPPTPNICITHDNAKYFSTSDITTSFRRQEKTHSEKSVLEEECLDLDFLLFCIRLRAAYLARLERLASLRMSHFFQLWPGYFFRFKYNTAPKC